MFDFNLSVFFLTEVSEEEITRWVKFILGVDRPSQENVPQPYSAENPPPEVSGIISF